MKLHNIPVTPKLVKIIINLDLTKVSGPDSIPVVVLRNCGPELSYILAMCLKKRCFPNYRKVSSVFAISKNKGRGLQLKTAVSLLSMVSKIFELLVNNKLVDHLEKDSVFSYFQYCFRSY